MEWESFKAEEMDKPYMKDLRKFIKQRREVTQVYPSSAEVFCAFTLPYKDVKCVLIGQDPYHNGQAHGLSFSAISGNTPPSLRVMRKSLGLSPTGNSNLLSWHNQGVMLLNRILTVERGKPLSHAGRGWEEFTKNAVSLLDKRKDVVFLLLGSYAQTLTKVIQHSPIVKRSHPASSLYQGVSWDNTWADEVNSYLNSPINWKSIE